MPINLIQHALAGVLTADSTVKVGDTFWTLGGLAMGLVLSGICLSLNMVHVEWTMRNQLHRDPDFLTRFPIHRFGVITFRYVDDVISVSSRLCGQCLSRYLQAIYPWNISFSDISEQQPITQMFVWLNFEISVRLTNCKNWKVFT